MFEISWKTRVAQHIYERNLITLQTSGHFWKPLYNRQNFAKVTHAEYAGTPNMPFKVD